MLLSVDYSPNNYSYFIHLVSLCFCVCFMMLLIFLFILFYFILFFFLGGGRGGAYIVTFYVVFGIGNCVKLEFLIGWLVLLLSVPSQQLWSLRDGQFT